MSYYSAKIEELRAAGCKINEVGQEVAICEHGRGYSILVGGDCPESWGRGERIEPAEARKIARLARAPGSAESESALAEALAELNLSEEQW